MDRINELLKVREGIVNEAESIKHKKLTSSFLDKLVKDNAKFHEFHNEEENKGFCRKVCF